MRGQRHRYWRVHPAEQGSSSRQPVQIGGADLAVPITAKVVRAQRIDGYQNDGRGPACQSEARESTQNTKDEPSPKTSNRTLSNPANQNWNRKAKLITLEVED